MDSASPELVPPAPPLVPVPSEGRDYLTPDEVAAAYEVTKQTVNRWLTIGVTATNSKGHRRRVILHARKIGGRWKITPAALAQFLKDIGSEAVVKPEPESATEKRRRVDACLSRLAASGLL